MHPTIEGDTYIATDGVDLKLWGLEKATNPRFYVDGKPVVVLTLEEAKKLQKEFVDVICDVTIATGFHKVILPKPTSFVMLEERIAQVEKENG